MSTPIGLPGAVATLGAPLQFKHPVKRVKLDVSKLSVAPKGTLYDIVIRTSKMTPEQAKQALENLILGMREQFGIETYYATASEDTILLEIKGSPFAWTTLLMWLPAILGLIGIAVLLISVWQIFASIPSWVWPVLIIGVGLVLLGPKIGELIIKTAVPYPGGKYA